MPIPNPRDKILPARGNYADLAVNVAALGDGEICYALDQDQYYQKESGALVSVGASKAQGALADSALQSEDIGSTVQAYDANIVSDASYVHTDENFTTADSSKLDGIEAGAEVNPVNVSELTNDAGYITAAEVPPGGVTSVNAQTGDVVLAASDVGAATAAQGALADTATQPGDNNSTLTNDAAYITLAEVPPDVVNNINIAALPVLP